MVVNTARQRNQLGPPACSRPVTEERPVLECAHAVLRSARNQGYPANISDMHGLLPLDWGCIRETIVVNAL